MKYFTSDTHFGSQRVRFYSQRPFKSVKKMDKALIKKWNKQVNKQDTVYHLGDFGDYSKVKKLNGKIILVFGNYEVYDMNNKFKNFAQFQKYLLSLGFYKVINESGSNVVFDNISKDAINLVHKPIDCKPNMFNLFGHIHAYSMVKDFGLNVGADCHNYTPISEKTVSLYKNAIENILDNNVFCQKESLK